MKPIFFISLLFFSLVSFAQDTINKRRFIPLVVISSVGYIGGIVGMNELWYKDVPKSKFHFFNDFHEWKQMDKVGHFTTAAVESLCYIEFLKWAGVTEKKAILWGPLTGFMLQAPIELLDGFSKNYGASFYDLSANAAGSAFIFAQHKIWNSIRITPKFSAHKSKYAELRPNVLGSNFAERTLKDYNGQTYWLSFNLHSFSNAFQFASWLNLSFGYSSNQMIYGSDVSNELAGFKAYRQYFISLDLDLNKIKTRNKLLKIVFYNLNFIHLPFPSLEFSQKKFSLHPIYY